MNIREKYGFGPLTVTVSWLEKCPKCQCDKVNVTGYSVTADSLWAGDEATCAKCGHKGEIDADGDNAWVEWGEVESGVADRNLSNHKHHFINGTCVECLKSE